VSAYAEPDLPDALGPWDYALTSTDDSGDEPNCIPSSDGCDDDSRFTATTTSDVSHLSLVVVVAVAVSLRVGHCNNYK